MSDWSENAVGEESVVARDRFERTESGSLGTSDVGGPWTLVGRGEDFSVASGSAHLEAGAGETLRAVLRDVSSRDVDLTVSVAVPSQPDGNGVYVAVFGRVIDDTGDDGYRLTINVDDAGEITGALASPTEPYLINGTVSFETTYTSGEIVQIRLQLEGTSPTRLRARVWLASDPEPEAWTLEAEDSTPELEEAGALGIHIYTSGSATRPSDVTFDDLVATALEP